jgi:hypothetical protein
MPRDVRAGRPGDLGDSAAVALTTPTTSEAILLTTCILVSHTLNAYENNPVWTEDPKNFLPNGHSPSADWARSATRRQAPWPILCWSTCHGLQIALNLL